MHANFQSNEFSEVLLRLFFHKGKRETEKCYSTGFSALNVCVGFMRAVYHLAIHAHLKMSTFVPRFPCKLNITNFNVEHSCIDLVLSTKIVILIFVL